MSTNTMTTRAINDDGQELLDGGGNHDIGSELMTLKQTREFCKISRTSLWDWENNKGLRTIVVGGIKRVRRSDLEAFLRRHERKKEFLDLAAAE